MRPTIRDVAQHAGVSIATVSRALRDSGSVRKDTRARVLEAAEQLNFTPSRLGRQLAERRHAANGIVFPDLSGPYYAEVVLGYEAVAAERERSVLILSTHGRANAEAMVEDLATRCDGMVVMGRTISDDAVERLVSRGMPVVLLARPPIGDIDSVNADNRTSAVALGRHMLAQGARRVAFVGDPAASPDVQERWSGLQDALAEASAKGEATVDLVSVQGFGEETGAAVARRALESRNRRPLPDAFVCANDELALGLMDTLLAADVAVPDRVLVSGWDDVMAARYAGLTTVRQPMRALGGTAARLLDELVTGARTEPRHELLPTELVTRASTSPHPAQK
ncbi:LacI family DNA-binding transcriptional regulator [Nocardioides iriomotensis]|uniref:LacI family transcriptional regulator n=1 Tax=Nocardioides iriomotensis TaxID=715784 RepID=A0A4Q5J372_9ACTN|nr:LacI family DNA-binding transcriptional regulator [Nocardioides iriomotensis]RYU11805.1 LacI family transcriptional regulator [Nocardioides iriomotensis]